MAQPALSPQRSVKVTLPNRTTLCVRATRHRAPTSAVLLKRFWNADPGITRVLPAWHKGETQYTVYGPLTFAESVHHYRIMLRRPKKGA